MPVVRQASSTPASGALHGGQAADVVLGHRTLQRAAKGGRQTHLIQRLRCGVNAAVTHGLRLLHHGGGVLRTLVGRMRLAGRYQKRHLVRPGLRGRLRRRAGWGQRHHGDVRVPGHGVTHHLGPSAICGSNGGARRIPRSRAQASNTRRRSSATLRAGHGLAMDCNTRRPTSLMRTAQRPC